MMILLAISTTIVAGLVGLRLMYPWLLTDIKYVSALIRNFVKYSANDRLMVDYFEANVKKHPDKVAVIYKDKSYTYKEINENANKVARAGQELGLKLGDTIALLMHNAPEFLWINLGLMKIGVKYSLINTSLKGKQLLHCIDVSDPKIIIVGEDEDLGEALFGIMSELKAKVYVHCSSHALVSRAFENFSKIVEKMSVEDIDRSCRQSLVIDDCACYIFTSGTTGLPKPAVVSHKRTLAGPILSGACGSRPDDIFYICLPLFHSNGLILGAYAALCLGGTLVLAKKFSKTHFFEDCRKHDVTVINYIGELFRFLLTNEKSDLDHQHKIRIAIGNGLRQDIYQEVVDRFKIPYIRELYAATEGSVGFMNLFNKVGSIGRCSPFLRIFLKCGFYKYDAENECLVRDEKGHCVPVKKGEPGLLLGAISKHQTFDGYKGKKELTESKVVRNVVKDGDAYFNSGDLMILDEDDFLYFNDRIGDTYRWKGENVSTTEVSNLLTGIEFVEDACVYGVGIPGHDGKAGMATLLIPSSVPSVTDSMLDAISEFCTETFPVYSRPVFIRLQWGNLALTSTIKQSKVSLKQEGYDIEVVTDPLFYFDKSTSMYKKLTTEIYTQILNQPVSF